MPDAISPELVTTRLTIRPATVVDAPAVVDYYQRNRAHLATFDPLRPDSFYTEAFWEARIRQDRRERASDRSLRLFLFPKHKPDRVIGIANFTQFVRGAAHHCTLGYAIDADQEGKGLMAEGLSAAIVHIFTVVRLHRIEASYMPGNERSGALLRRLGFTVDGLARDYLLIAGRWEDHVLTSLTNPAWGELG